MGFLSIVMQQLLRRAVAKYNNALCDRQTKQAFFLQETVRVVKKMYKFVTESVTCDVAVL